MQIIAISDLHGNLINLEEDFDLLLICGDICPASNHSLTFQKKWLFTDFCKWINSLKFKDNFSKVVLLPGNHDFWFEANGNDDDIVKELITKCDNKLVYLHNTLYTHEYINEHGNINKKLIFGTPYCKQFFNWAFMLNENELKEKYDKIPYGIDILITHDAPDINEMGVINSGFNKGVNAGNKLLGEIINERAPKYCFCGHIHSGNRELMYFPNNITQGCNVSICTEAYQPYQKPLIITI